MIRLNGWQRLWVVVALIYGVLIASEIVHQFHLPPEPFHPTKHDSFYVVDLDRIPGAHRKDLVHEVARQWAVDDSELMDDTLNPNQMMDRIRCKINDSCREYTPDMVFGALGPVRINDPQPFEKMYRDAYSEYIKHEIMTLVSRIVFDWLLPVAGLYVFGFAVGWVYRGFRRQ